MAALSLDDLADRAIGLVPAEGRAILGITGKPGAGKTTLARGLVATLGARGRVEGHDVAHVPMDGFHLADAELVRLGLRDRKGAPETFDAAGYAQLLGRLRRRDGPIVYAPGFERDLEQPIAASIAVPATVGLVITEGNYLLLDSPSWPTARAELDEVWYVDVDDELRTQRLIARHVTYGKTPDAAAAWVARSDESNARLVERTRGLADLTVDATTWPEPRS